MTDLTLQERLDRHPGLTFTKKLEEEGKGASEWDENWDCRRWRVTLTFRETDDDGTFFTHPHTPSYQFAFHTGLAWAEDGSDIHLSTVASTLLSDWALYENHVTFEKYCDEFGGNSDSRKEFKRWEEGKKEVGQVAGFFENMALRGGDSTYAWLHETEHTDY